jgi:hypothetical protein
MTHVVIFVYQVDTKTQHAAIKAITSKSSGCLLKELQSKQSTDPFSVLCSSPYQQRAYPKHC